LNHTVGQNVTECINTSDILEIAAHDINENDSLQSTHAAAKHDEMFCVSLAIIL